MAPRVCRGLWCPSGSPACTPYVRLLITLEPVSTLFVSANNPRSPLLTLPHSHLQHRAHSKSITAPDVIVCYRSGGEKKFKSPRQGMTHCRLSERPGGSQTRRKRSAPLTFLNGERPGVVGRSNVPKWERGRGGGGHVGSNCRRRSTIEHLLTRLQSLFCFFIAWFYFLCHWRFKILQTKSYDDLEPPRIEDSNQKKNNVDHGFLNGFALGHS